MAVQSLPKRLYVLILARASRACTIVETWANNERMAGKYVCELHRRGLFILRNQVICTGRREPIRGDEDPVLLLLAIEILKEEMIRI